jgi:hypothetical protein
MLQYNRTAVVWMFESIQNSYVETLTLKLMVLGGRTFGKQLDKGKALISVISALI